MLNQPLTPRAANDTMPPISPFDWKKYLEGQRIMLRMWLNDVERMLGYNPKRCPHCGNELK
jgi:hypothetical protein